MYGGMFVGLADRVPGETHILQADQETASEGFCCPVCPADIFGHPTNRKPCQITIKHLSAGLYDVQIPPFLYPGGFTCLDTRAGKEGEACSPKLPCMPAAGQATCEGYPNPNCACGASPSGGSGVCDATTNMANTSVAVGIERSTDPTGFTPANPLSVTSCIDMRGPCASALRISIRESCKQLIWSTGKIESRLTVGGPDGGGA